MNEPVLTAYGNITRVPELRYSPAGVAVTTFNMASTPREKNRDTDRYEDGVTLWLKVTCFRAMAENVAESLKKGSRVVVTGKLKREEWEDKEGNKRDSLVLLADEVGASLKFGTVDVKKVDRGSENAPKARPAEDPWATSGPVEDGEDGEPPF